jgi:hypothetical protein
MASVAATVENGSFKQPILTAGTKQVTASALPMATDTDLKEMMRAVVTSGTADDIGFGPTVYAKTGTADVVGQGQPNSWLIAFDPTKDIAVAALVLNGLRRPVRGPRGQVLPRLLLRLAGKLVGAARTVRASLADRLGRGQDLADFAAGGGVAVLRDGQS